MTPAMGALPHVNRTAGMNKVNDMIEDIAAIFAHPSVFKS